MFHAAEAEWGDGEGFKVIVPKNEDEETEQLKTYISTNTSSRLYMLPITSSFSFLSSRSAAGALGDVERVIGALTIVGLGAKVVVETKYVEPGSSWPRMITLNRGQRATICAPLRLGDVSYAYTFG